MVPLSCHCQLVPGLGSHQEGDWCGPRAARIGGREWSSIDWSAWPVPGIRSRTRKNKVLEPWAHDNRRMASTILGMQKIANLLFIKENA